MLDIGKIKGRIVIDYVRDYGEHSLGIDELIKIYIKNEEHISTMTAIGMLEAAKTQILLGGYEFIDENGDTIYCGEDEEE